MEMWLKVCLAVVGIAILIIIVNREAIIRATLGVKDPYYKAHPELREGEVFLTNDDEEGFLEIGWITKRMGNTAYTIQGNPIEDAYPIFVQKHELIEAGINHKKLEKKWNRV